PTARTQRHRRATLPPRRPPETPTHPHPTPASAITTTDELHSARLRASHTRDWRTQVEATRGCAAPIHLRGSSRVLDRDGAVLLEREGTVLAPCGNRRATICPPCSQRYSGDAYHLLRAGLAGDDTKAV